MAKIKMTAIFKGKNGSCGYLTMKEYTIEVEQTEGSFISIKNTKKFGGETDYSTIVSFLKNWCIIHTYNDK